MPPQKKSQAQRRADRRLRELAEEDRALAAAVQVRLNQLTLLFQLPTTLLVSDIKSS